MKVVLPLILAMAWAIAPVQAAPLVDIRLPSSSFGGGGYLGLEGVRASAAFGIEVACGSTSCDPVVRPVEAQITSGALLDVVSEPDKLHTIYTYEWARIDASFSWINDDEERETGEFSAPLFNFGMFLQLTVREGPGAFRPLTQDYLSLGPGLFDENVASRLNVQRATLGGDFNFYLEGLRDCSSGDCVRGDETSVRRGGSFNSPQVLIKATAVPEPSSIGLLALGLLLVGARRKARPFPL